MFSKTTRRSLSAGRNVAIHRGCCSERGEPLRGRQTATADRAAQRRVAAAVAAAGQCDARRLRLVQEQQLKLGSPAEGVLVLVLALPCRVQLLALLVRLALLDLLVFLFLLVFLAGRFRATFTRLCCGLGLCVRVGLCAIRRPALAKRLEWYTEYCSTRKAARRPVIATGRRSRCTARARVCCLSVRVCYVVCARARVCVCVCVCCVCCACACAARRIRAPQRSKDRTDRIRCRRRTCIGCATCRLCAACQLSRARGVPGVVEDTCQVCGATPRAAGWEARRSVERRVLIALVRRRTASRRRPPRPSPPPCARVCAASSSPSSRAGTWWFATT